VAARSLPPFADRRRAEPATASAGRPPRRGKTPISTSSYDIGQR